ncbi:ribosomal protein eS27-like isoform X1 [Lagenorhynchus albirostris]|uniref:ribosomal protein eS27-like isoform X1 n=1 Tax=Lagenorhynchus albirostris TaxID=27610 RepID=UPI0028E3BBB5|nr:ribosomal protein eS27-like isoform X1 [Lagenorhynchus albirostris]
MAPRAPGSPGRTRLGCSDPAALSRVVDLLGLARRRGKSGPAWAWSRWDCTRRRPGCSLESMAGRGQLPGYLSQPSWLARDLLHPSLEEEKKKHKKKRLVQSPNSYFMDVKCPGCYKITTVFSHAQTVVLCVGCSTVLCQPTGGKARLTEGCSFRRKQH